MGSWPKSLADSSRHTRRERGLKENVGLSHLMFFLICLAGDGNIALEEGIDVLQQASAYYLAEIDKSAHRGEVSNATSLR